MLLLHLSDIHFRKGEVGVAMDPNAHLRNEITRDVESFCKTIGRSPDAVLISGDIAFGGEPTEFAFAMTWLRDLWAELSSVFTIFEVTDAARDQHRREKPVGVLVCSNVGAFDWRGGDCRASLAFSSAGADQLLIVHPPAFPGLTLAIPAEVANQIDALTRSALDGASLADLPAFEEFATATTFGPDMGRLVKAGLRATFGGFRRALGFGPVPLRHPSGRRPDGCAMGVRCDRPGGRAAG